VTRVIGERRAGVGRALARGALILGALALHAPQVRAHSASDAYLTLTVDAGKTTGQRVIHGQWDIALRDLDFVLKLDDNGDGHLTWGEVRRHQDAIARYAYGNLHLSGAAGGACRINPERQMIDDHADGAYAVLVFTAICAPQTTKLALAYGIFFAIDPSHRGIFVMQNGASTATAVLSPEHAMIDLSL
jgi:hypothetical protein